MIMTYVLPIPKPAKKTPTTIPMSNPLLFTTCIEDSLDLVVPRVIISGNQEYEFPVP